MTARQQSLTAKIPRYAALYFPAEDTTGVAPSTNITTGRLEKGSEVKANWDGDEVTAVVISLSNSRADLDDAIETFMPPNSTTSGAEPVENGAGPSRAPAASSKIVAKNNVPKKKEQKTPTAYVLASGKPAQERGLSYKRRLFV